jgi:ribose transport system ATP-binding protein
LSHEWSTEQVSKHFGGTAALREVDLTFRSGLVHGVVGENGAGKSTLVRIMTGAVRASQGRVLLDGQEVELKSPRQALELGSCLVSQELTLLSARSVIDNVYLGNRSVGSRLVRPRRRRLAFAELCERSGIRLPADARVGDLSLAQQQHVEVLRALARDPKLIVFDEPTAILAEDDTERMLALIRRLASGGAAVVLISHFLEEILSTCDLVSVLRDGRHIRTGPAADETTESLIEAMVGSSIEAINTRPRPMDESAPVAVSTHGLTRGRAVRDVDITVRVGEIVGIAGLVGSGRTELLRLIFGADRIESGTVRLFNVPMPRRLSPRRAIAAGVAMVPEDRKDEGLVLRRSVSENLTLATLRRVSWCGALRPRAERRQATRLAAQCDIRARHLSDPMWSLSGGNQQKTLFAKWLARSPKILLVDEPTRGVDIAAKGLIHRLVLDAAAAGVAVLVVSSEIEELLAVCHRMYVLRQGVIVTEFRADEVDRETVLRAAFADVRSGAA